MVTYSKHCWNQVKGKTCGEICDALERDGFEYDEGEGRSLIFRHQDGRRIAMHFHPGKTYGPGLLKDLLVEVGWVTDDDLRRVKLIK